MKSSNLVKVAAAFLIGVVVALGSALLYVRMDEVPDKAVSVVPPAPESSQMPEFSPLPEKAVPARNEPKPLPKVRLEAKPKPVRPIQAQTKEPITVIAQSYPPTANTAPAPARTSYPTIQETASPLPTPTPAPVEPAMPTSPVREPHVVTLQPGTNLAIRLGETLDSDHNYPGDTFRGFLAAPIVVDGFIIADRGSKVLGKVMTAQAAGRVQGLSELTLALTEINTTDGQRIHIQTDFYSRKGTESTGADAAKIAGGAAIGAIIGAIAGGGKGAAIGAGAGGAAGTGIVLATRGKPTTLPSETPLTFRLSAPVMITEQFNN